MSVPTIYIVLALLALIMPPWLWFTWKINVATQRWIMRRIGRRMGFSDEWIDRELDKKVSNECPT